MKGIVSYIKEYGKYTLQEMPLNEVDTLILSQLSYLKFDSMVPSPTANQPSVTLKSILKHEAYEELYADKRYEKVNRSLFQAAASSKRFGNLKLNNYISLLDEDWELQFSAMTFLFEDGLVYVAFRGTDENMVGWKEDFNMAYMCPIPAQEKAVQYLNLVGEHIARDFVVGGHSKGGNLAVYGAMMCKKTTQSRICAIYSHDGPGFLPQILQKPEFSMIHDRIHKLIPRSSVVGMMLQTQENYEVVECRKFGILQHDPFNWIVEENHFVKADNIHIHSALSDNSVNQWMANMDEEQRKEFIDQLFGIFETAGVTNLSDFKTEWKSLLPAIMTAIEQMGSESKDMMKVIFKNLFDEISMAVKTKVIEKVEEIQQLLDNQLPQDGKQD